MGRALLSHNTIIPNLYNGSDYLTLFGQTRMAAVVSKPLQSCLLPAHVAGTGSCRKGKDTLLWLQKPPPHEPLNHE